MALAVTRFSTDPEDEAEVLTARAPRNIACQVAQLNRMGLVPLHSPNDGTSSSKVKRVQERRQVPVFSGSSVIQTNAARVLGLPWASLGKTR